MKILMKIMIIVLVIFSVNFILQQNSFSSSLSGSSIMGKAGEFLNKGKSNEKLKQSDIERDLLPVGNIVFGFAIMVLLVVGAIMGVKYMISGADERANMKQKLVWYVVAAVLVFGATGVYNAVYKIMSAATK